MRKWMKAAAVSAALVLSGAGGIASAQDAETEGVGDVVYSVLPPELFEKAHSGRWVLLDGGALPASSPLYRFLVKEGRLDIFAAGGGPARLFDARGVFIRGMNLNRAPAEGDPAGSSRPVGSKQEDQVGKHNHPAVIYDHAQRTGLATKDRFTAPRSDAPQTKTTGDAGSNAATPKDTETRPKNIALYVYIKVGGVKAP